MDPILLVLPVLVVAAAYASVGHAGASGYLALMAIAGVSMSASRPSALIMNLVVASVATVMFARKKAINWKLVGIFAIASVPAACIGGFFGLSDHLYKIVLGCLLLVPAARLLLPLPDEKTAMFVSMPPLPIALCIGGVIGLLSGMIGIGGGVFLSPIIILAKWADARTTAGVSAAFILINSAAGLIGWLGKSPALPPGLVWWVPAAAIGGLLGSYLGSSRFGGIVMRRTLAGVLVFAALKMVVV